MRKSAIPVMILLLASLPILYAAPYLALSQTSETTTTTITTRNLADADYMVSLLTNQNFTGTGTGGTQNWTYKEWGNNPDSADGYLHTSDYYSSPASATLRLQYRSRQCELGWTQPFTYSGTTDIVYARLTFRWKCANYYYAGSANYVEIRLEAPIGSGNWIQIYRENFYSTTGWNYVAVDIGPQLKQYGAATYQFEADAYLTTGSTYFATPSVIVRYDDVGIAVQYTVKQPPSGLSLAINNNATYANSRLVTLSLAGSGVDKMYLSNTSTLPPTPAWEPFSTTKQVSLTPDDGTKTIYFWAKNTAGVTGPASDSIILDINPPSAPTLLSPENGTAMKNNAPTFVWYPVTDIIASGLANYTLEYSQDKAFSSGVTTVPGLTGESYTPASSLSDGTWYWHVRAIDNAGNVGEWSKPYYVVVVDTVYPNAPTLVSPSSGTTTSNAKPTFTWNQAGDSTPSSGIANHTLQYSKDPNFSSGVTAVTVTMPILSYTIPSGSPLSDGTWYWRVRATDKAGCVGSYSAYWSIVVDTIPPNQPSLVSPNNGQATNDNTPTFSWGAATDATSGVDFYTLQFDNAELFNSPNMRNATGLGLSYTISSALADGTWYWRVNATDKAGNRGSYSGYRSIVIDTVTPNQPTLSSPADGATTDVNTPTFTWSAAGDQTPSSGIANYTLQLDTSPSFNTDDLRTISGITGTSHTVVTPLGDGTWHWRVRAADNAGNTGSYSAERTIVINTAITGAPTLVAPTNGVLTKNNTQTFSWSNVGATSYDLYIDKSPQFNNNTGDLKTFLGLTNTSKVARNLIDGNLYWKVIAQPGEKNSSTRGIMVDTVAPSTPALSSPINGALTNVTHPLLVWSLSTDLTSGVSNYTLQYSQDPAFVVGVGTVPGLTNTSYRIPNPLSDGTWYWRVRAFDKALNPSNNGSSNFGIDTQPPTGLSLSLSGSYTKSLTITLTIAAFDADTMYLSNDGSNWMSYAYAASMQWNLTAGDGTKQVYFKCRDAAGNWAYLSPLYRTITLDTVPPAAGSPSVPAYGSITGNNKTTFQWSAGSDGDGSGIASYGLQLDTTTTFSSGNLTELTATGTSHTLTSALADCTWYWRISATDVAGNIGYYSAYFKLTINTVPPGKVTSLSLPANDSLLGLASPQFEWNSVHDAYGYHIQLDKSLSFSSSDLIENLTLSNNRFNPSVDNNETLTDGTWYWRVEAISLTGIHGGYMFLGAFVVDITPPGNPQPVSPPNLAATKTRYHTPFGWSQIQDATSYWLQLCLASDFSSSEVITTPNIAGNSCLVEETLVDGLWYWRVISLDAAGNVGNSLTAPTSMLIIDTVSPSQPTPRSPSEGFLTNMATLELAWYATSDPTSGGISSGIANYTVRIDNSSSFDSADMRTTGGLTGTSYSLTSPLSDGTWYWSVNATDRAGNTGQGSVTLSFTVDTVAPAPPQVSSMNPNGVSVGVSKVTLTWNPSSDPSGIASYMIQLDTSSGFDSPALLDYPDVGGTTLTTAKELSNGRWYWRVAAVDRAGNLGDWSEPVPFTVDVPGPISPMTVIMIGGGSSGAFILAALGYLVYRRAKIPFVIKKIDQSIKLISKGEVPQKVPMRTRAQLINGMFETKLGVLSRKLEEVADSLGVLSRKLEGAEGKKKIPREIVSPEKSASQTTPKVAEPPTQVEAEESDVDLVAKELEKLEGTAEKKPSDETELIKREIEELEKGSKKKRKSGSD